MLCVTPMGLEAEAGLGAEPGCRGPKLLTLAHQGRAVPIRLHPHPLHGLQSLQLRSLLHSPLHVGGHTFAKSVLLPLPPSLSLGCRCPTASPTEQVLPHMHILGTASPLPPSN